MKIQFAVVKSDGPCSKNIKTVDVPGINSDVWLCVHIIISIWFWETHKVYAIHLV